MVSGMDTLTVTSVCDADGIKLVLSANGGSGPVTVTVKSDVFDTVKNVPGGQVRFSGMVNCSGTNCTTDVTMNVWWSRGSSHVWQGDVSVTLNFVRYAKTMEKEHWSETCTQE